jgi:hypothetical protein
MGYKQENKKVLVSKYLEIAHERLRTAEAALKIESYRDSISRSYYAFLDAALACLVTKDLVPQSHAGAITLFGLHFIKTGEIESKYGRWFNKIERARLEADYEHTKSFTIEEAEDALKEAKEFVRVVEELLPKLLSGCSMQDKQEI